MTFEQLLTDHLRGHQAALAQLETLAPDARRVAQACVTAVTQGGKILTCGNGGSAADAQHFASELTGRYRRERRPLAAIALTTDSSALTCIGNDYSFDEVFSRQVEALARPGDVVVGFSTSGASRNVALALRAARQVGATTVAFTGERDGAVHEHADLALRVPSATTAHVQEMHILLVHVLCEWIDEAVLNAAEVGA